MVGLLLIASIILSCSILNHLRHLKKHLNELKNMLFGIHYHFVDDHSIISCQGVQFFVPNFSEDILQRNLITTGNFYEIAILRQLDTLLPEQAIIFDIGANIGNHSLYWAKKRRAKKIYAFEPIPETFRILEKNIQLNHVEDIVIARNIALSDCRESLTIKSFSPENIGGTSLQKSASGNLRAIDLDHFKFPENNVDLIKIDVEGFECNVLRGAMNFLKNFSPKFIFIEVLTSENLQSVNNILTSLGYTLQKEFQDHNFLYKFIP
jgi:FkbM family methyltransferase